MFFKAKAKTQTLEVPNTNTHWIEITNQEDSWSMQGSLQCLSSTMIPETWEEDRSQQILPFPLMLVSISVRSNQLWRPSMKPGVSPSKMWLFPAMMSLIDWMLQILVICTKLVFTLSVGNDVSKCVLHFYHTDDKVQVKCRIKVKLSITSIMTFLHQGTISVINAARK